MDSSGTVEVHFVVKGNLAGSTHIVLTTPQEMLLLEMLKSLKRLRTEVERATNPAMVKRGKPASEVKRSPVTPARGGHDANTRRAPGSS